SKRCHFGTSAAEERRTPSPTVQPASMTRTLSERKKLVIFESSINYLSLDMTTKLLSVKPRPIARESRELTRTGEATTRGWRQPQRFCPAVGRNQVRLELNQTSQWWLRILSAVRRW